MLHSPQPGPKARLSRISNINDYLPVLLHAPSPKNGLSDLKFKTHGKTSIYDLKCQKHISYDNISHVNEAYGSEDASTI